jgi:hypothetical protein
MKYFTLDWYKSQYPDDDDETPEVGEWPDAAHRGYASRLQELEDKLGADLLKLARLPGVHDAYITLVRHDKRRNILALTLRGGDSLVGDFDLALRYHGADISPESERTLAYLARSTGVSGRYTYGPSIHRHEVDRTEDGRIEHRFLFHGGYWFSIACDDLRWARLPRPNHRFPRRFDRFPGGPTTPIG